MRPDAAAGRRIAHHDVVETRVRNEAEFEQQRLRARQHFVHALHEQRPAARWKTRQRSPRKRSMSDVPAPAVTRDEPRLHVVARRQLEERLARDDILILWERAARKQQSLLP